MLDLYGYGFILNYSQIAISGIAFKPDIRLLV